MAKYTGLYGMDLTPEEEAAGFLDISQAADTPTYGIPEFEKKFYASRDYGALPSMYELYLGGGFPGADTAQIPGAIDTLVDAGGGAGDAAQIPGAIDTLVTAPDYTNVTTATEPPGGGDPDMYYDPYSNVTTATAPPSILNPYDTTPDYSNVRTSDPRLTARGTPISEMGTRPPDFVAGAQTFTDPDPSARIDARGTTVTGTRPPDFVAGVPELGPVKPGITNPRVSPLALARADAATPEISTTRPAGIDAPMIAPQTTFPDQVDFDQGFIDAGDFSAPGTLADPAEKMDYTEKSPSWWESARDKFVSTGQDVGNFFTDLKDQGIDIARMAGPAIISLASGIPGMGLILSAMEETPLDRYNNEYAIGGKFYEEMAIDPETGKQTPLGERLDSYSDQLKSGNLPNQDPFGINTTSIKGDYPAYATKTVNEISAKAATGATLSQFEKDQFEYYGKVSGLTGETNIAGTPLMADQPISLDNIIEEQEAKEDLAKITGDAPVGIDAGTADIQDFADIYEPPAQVAAPTYTQPSPHRHEGPDPPGGGGGGWGPWAAKGGLIRKPYGKGGIVDLLK
jgi:hypothetical protein